MEKEEEDGGTETGGMETEGMEAGGMETEGMEAGGTGTEAGKKRRSRRTEKTD